MLSDYPGITFRQFLLGVRQMHRPDFLTPPDLQSCAPALGYSDNVLKGPTVSSRATSIFDPVQQPAKLSGFPRQVSALDSVESEALDPRRGALILK